ncbi:MAG: MBL fold metallo-hydrolase [Anditalea sp.]
MAKIHIIDLNFLQENQTIAAFLIETNKGPILIETGPESTWTQLEKGINMLGYQPADIKHVLLTHIHFDHAGAAWKLAESGSTIYVHPIGLPHLASPERLWNSAAQIYGKDMERLWGKMKPVPEDQLKEIHQGEYLQLGDLTIKALHTPGHAVHHIAWQLDNIIFTGDVAGVKINQGPVVPPCPPPDIHLENWIASIALLKEQNPKQIYLTHFGRVDEPQAHLDELEEILINWANWMKPHYEHQNDPKRITPKFMDYTKNQLKAKGVSMMDIQRYEYANPSWMSVNGLLRYWRLKDQGRI